jgi:hypothetical protein
MVTGENAPCVIAGRSRIGTLHQIAAIDRQRPAAYRAARCRNAARERFVAWMPAVSTIGHAVLPVPSLAGRRWPRSCSAPLAQLACRVRPRPAPAARQEAPPAGETSSAAPGDARARTGRARTGEASARQIPAPAGPGRLKRSAAGATSGAEGPTATSGSATPPPPIRGTAPWVLAASPAPWTRTACLLADRAPPASAAPICAPTPEGPPAPARSEEGGWRKA